ncbi:MAG: hypothetical protein WCR30_00660 [Clostridia bacterium]
MFNYFNNCDIDFSVDAVLSKKTQGVKEFKKILDIMPIEFISELMNKKHCDFLKDGTWNGSLSDGENPILKIHRTKILYSTKTNIDIEIVGFDLDSILDLETKKVTKTDLVKLNIKESDSKGVTKTLSCKWDIGFCNNNFVITTSAEKNIQEIAKERVHDLV